MLRGAELDSVRSNIQAIIDKVRAVRPATHIVLVGMMAPPNYGQEYTQRFRGIFPEIAERNDLPLVPFLLEGVGGEARYNLPDGIHPNAEGQRRVAATVWKKLEPVLRTE
jgi:acyl-CoA thioesterase-1